MTDRGYNPNATNEFDRAIEQEDARYEDQAREIGTEHGRNAASWVELDEQTAEAIDQCQNVYDVLEPSSPLSGEWADGYSIDALVYDVGLIDDEVDTEAGDYGQHQDLADAYEEAYWQAFEAEVERKVEAMRGPVPKLDPDGVYVGPGPGKVALRIDGFTFGGRVRTHMVGDDREIVYDVDELTQIDEDAYCGGCGAVGPPCYGWEVDDDSE